MITNDNTEHSPEPTKQPTKRNVRHEAHYNADGRIVWEAIEVPVKVTPAKPPTKPPVLNHEQRRLAHRLLRHKIALRLAKTPRRDQAKQSIRCERCGQAFLASPRCQCQVRSSHECALCHEKYLASSRERRYANVCSSCGVVLVAQRENEEASAAEA